MIVLYVIWKIVWAVCVGCAWLVYMCFLGFAWVFAFIGGLLKAWWDRVAPMMDNDRSEFDERDGR